MSKVIVAGVAAIMLTVLLNAASEGFVKDTYWMIYLQAGNNTWNSVMQNWGNAGADVGLGNSTPGTVDGTSMSSWTTAYVRDMSGGGGNGYGRNIKAALDQTDYEQEQTWDDIVLFAGQNYSSSGPSLRVWTAGVSANGPRIQLVVTQADPGTGFTVGQVLLYSATASPPLTADTSKHFPAGTIDLSAALPYLKAANAASAHVRLKLVAITPASGWGIVVIDDGAETADPTRLHASWGSTWPPGRITRWEYAIGTSPADLVVGWTNAGASQQATETGLNLDNSHKYYWFVRGYEGDYYIDSNQSNGITVVSPNPPAVVDDGTYTPDLVSMHGSWYASDPSGIIEYQYAIGTSPSSLIVPWKSAGTATEATETGLSLLPGLTYYFYAKAKNGRGIWSLPRADYNGMTAVTTSSIAEVRRTAPPNITAVYLPGVVRTSGYLDLPGLWVGSANGSSGIRVNWSWSGARGDRLDIAGQFSWIDGVPTLNKPEFKGQSSGMPLDSLAFTATHLANDRTESLSYIGLNPVGLLVTAWGRVTKIDTAAHAFYIEDGSGLADGMGPSDDPFHGLRVAYKAEWVPAWTLPGVDTYVKVTGIRTVEKNVLTSDTIVNGTPRLSGQVLYVPILVPRDTGDIRVVE